jgi:hypothetical protein
MQLAEVLDKLGYQDSPNFLRSGTADFRSAADYGHIFRRAAEAPCALKGVYVLREPPQQRSRPIVPVVYVCEARSDTDANKIHRLVWNQDVVPFLIVNTRDTVRLYSGFRHKNTPKDFERGVIRVLQDFRNATDVVEGFHADSIDNGRLWRQWGREVAPTERVDWKLLDNLKTLDGWLQNKGKLKKETSHALIGKYVYLHYLRGRDILSDKKFAKFGIAPEDVLGCKATLKGVRSVVRQLDKWLNGSIFPLQFGGDDGVGQDHLRWVAATFMGDTLNDEGYRQLHLDFAAYDFSYIPIETLSVVYEQFLHGPSEGKMTSKARTTGAYYTPIPVVNYILSELEERRPLEKGMRVFDPSCGSGAFLVQCYRRLIEKEFPFANRRPSPMELRKLLQRHIFGVDSDPDACSVTELSLILTLLDYVNPPDLEDRPQFKLPALRGRNIFHADFFQENAPWQAMLARKKCDWIVGNPPWKKPNPRKLKETDRPAWTWMAAHKDEKPVGGNQIAQAFAWAVGDYLAPGGEVGMLLPAMTLFENPSRAFRAAFFRQMEVGAVANFSNLAEVLFAGRSRVPAAAFFYQGRLAGSTGPTEDEQITVYSPLVANQEPTRPVAEKTRNEIWSLVVNASEIRRIAAAEVNSGSGLPWKLAAWGSHLDRRLLNRLAHRFPSLKDLEEKSLLVVSEGLQLRRKGSEEVEFVQEVVGKNGLNMEMLRKLGQVFAFPPEAIEKNPRELSYVRQGRVLLPLSVCRPPHVIVSAARNFAVYTEDYLIVPPRQIGIISTSDDKNLLKALSLFLSSDFAFYHQFLTSTQFGVQRGLATLGALRRMPIPVECLAGAASKDWVRLHARLVNASQRALAEAGDADRPLWRAKELRESMESLLGELNALVNDSLQLDERERALVHDLVHVRLGLRDGMLGEMAVRRPEVPELRSYARRLKSDLDAFLKGESPKRHKVAIVYDHLSGMVCADLATDSDAAKTITVVEGSETTASHLEQTRQKLRRQCSQWVYFDRNLRLYVGTCTYLLKPMQRFHWTDSQAMFDASEIIAETLAGPGGKGR